MFFSTKKKTFYSRPKFDQKFIDFAKVFKSMLKQLNMKNLHVFFAWIHRKLARFYDKKITFWKTQFNHVQKIDPIHYTEVTPTLG